jgi:hypothetical protein
VRIATALATIIMYTSASAGTATELLHVCRLLSKHQAMQPIHSSCTSLIVAVRLSCTQSACCCSTTAVRCAAHCALLNEQSHANHSVQLPSLFVAVRLSCTSALQYYSSGAACALLVNAEPCQHSFSCTSLFVAYSYHVQSAACCGTTAVRCCVM